MGFLEHPSIWVFFCMGAIVPFNISAALKSFYKFLSGNDIIHSETDLSVYADYFRKFSARDIGVSRFLYYLLTAAGFICLAFNTYQNQQPYRYLAFDFWDSIFHPFGYTATRLFKFYLWVLFLPAFAHIYITLVFTIVKLLKDAKTKAFINLQPYHHDRNGGVAIIMEIVIKPFIPLLSIVALNGLAVYYVHQKLDATPLIGLFMATLFLLVFYTVPAYYLMELIKFHKKQYLKEITDRQNIILSNMKKPENIALLLSHIDSLNGMQHVIKQINSVPEWPYSKQITKMVLGIYTGTAAIIGILDSVNKYKHLVEPIVK